MLLALRQLHVSRLARASLAGGGQAEHTKHERTTPAACTRRHAPAGINNYGTLSTLAITVPL